MAKLPIARENRAKIEHYGLSLFIRCRKEQIRKLSNNCRQWLGEEHD